MREVRFRVDGLPVAQGSKVQGTTKDGRSYMREDNAGELRRWRRDIRAVASLHRLDVIRQSPLFLGATFYVREPPRGRVVGEWAPVVPDFDKLVRALCDALVQAKVMVDDAQIVDSRIRKRYGPPGVRVLVRDAG